MVTTQNLFDDPPESATCEQVLELLSRPGLTIDRIVSTGQASPPDFWYDQPHGEWVLVVQGEARIAFEGDAAPRLLKSGDFINIAPRQRHRVEWTHPKVPTIWLTVNYTE